MLIDPKVTKLDIFNNGGAIVQREIKLSLQQGINDFQIQNISASFDPNSAEIKLEYIKAEDKELISLQQTITSLPDKKNANQVISREKSAADNIISHSIDFTHEMRENISGICEANSYRTYADMIGTFDFIINSKIEGEIVVKILYFINDFRIKWSTRLIVKIANNNKTAEMEGFIIVDNQTGFSYNNVDLGFAVFELPNSTLYSSEPEGSIVNLPEQAETQYEFNDDFFAQPNIMNKMKRTQRYKQIK